MANTPMVTYETFAAAEEDARAFRAQLERVAGRLGERHPFHINGVAQTGEGWIEERSPADSRVPIGEFASATMDDFDRAVEAARRFAPEWAATEWRERVRIVAGVSAKVTARRHELAAILAYEIGKPLLEALGEVDECVVLIDYYCAQMAANEGFALEMGPAGGVATGGGGKGGGGGGGEGVAPPADGGTPGGEHVYSLLRPYGVWGVIGPFNFPMALLLGPIAAALIAGNTVVAKPSPHGYLSGLAVYELFGEAGVPAGALQMLNIPDERLGKRLYTHPGLDGLTFTGSHATGMRVFHGFSREYPRPAICEMGGKNPAIVTASADLRKAAVGVARSAFGFSGQRCSGCSRVLVAREVHDELAELLEQRRREVCVASPLDPATQVGPVISRASVERLLEAARECGAEGWRVHGGGALTAGELRFGNYAEPTVAEIPAADSRLLREELFTPFVALHPVGSLDEALELANGLVFGLTAGLYAEDSEEIERFRRTVKAGVIYVNREAGATTGAWPGIQSFGGWEGSGSTGRGAGGIHYLQQYMREQSVTVVGS
ncbi:MAG TPA: aldehyde dehydrogenase family protein [Solirubrobacteraceae bacterium]|jgi:1-pyrroline-5-carboxylate dehydrogenase|nr:aldehyde dehydrogenase family protein [Solirubrobacteraceae bacterium]